MSDSSSKTTGQPPADARFGNSPERLEVLGLLAAGVAHELNNWFFVIRGFSELARFDLEQDHPVIDKLDRIEEGIDRAELLNRMVLESAHPSSDGIISVQLHPVVKEAVKLVRESLSGRVRVLQTIDTEAPAAAVDPMRLFPSVTSLLREASRQITDDGSHLRVSLGEAEAGRPDEHRWLALRIGWATNDEGDEVWNALVTGVDPSNDGEPEFDGLARIRETVTGFGGRLQCRTAGNDGALFEVLLPVATGPALRS